MLLRDPVEGLRTNTQRGTKMDAHAKQDRILSQAQRKRAKEILEGLGYHVDADGGYDGTHLYPTPQVTHTCLELRAHPEHLQLNLHMDVDAQEIPAAMEAA